MSDLEQHARYLVYRKHLLQAEEVRKQRLIDTLRGPSERRAHPRHEVKAVDLSDLPPS